MTEQTVSIYRSMKDLPSTHLLGTGTPMCAGCGGLEALNQPRPGRARIASVTEDEGVGNHGLNLSGDRALAHVSLHRWQSFAALANRDPASVHEHQRAVLQR